MVSGCLLADETIENVTGPEFLAEYGLALIRADALLTLLGY